MKKVLSLLAASAGVLALGAGPAMAAGTGTGVISSASIQPAATTAGSSGGSGSTANLAFNYGASSTDTVKSLSLTLPVGFWAAPGAVSATCTSAQAASNTCPAASQIGQGTATVNITGVANNVPLTAGIYQTPPPSANDVDGLVVVLTTSSPYPADTIAVNGTADVVDNAQGQPQVVLNVPQVPNSTTVGGSTDGVQVTNLNLTLNGTVDGKQFLYLPTNCTTAATNVAVTTYAGSPGTATDAFTPTGCPLGFTGGSFAGTATDTAPGKGDYAQVNTLLTLPTGGATAASATIAVPPALTPNVAYASLNCPSTAPYTGCPNVGTATASSPLVPGTISGQVYLTGNLSNLGLAVVFPAPFNITLAGTVSLSPQQVVFKSLPDVPLSQLAISFSGGSGAAFVATCAPGSQTASATLKGSGGGPSVTLSGPLTVSGCPGSAPSGGGGGGGTPTTTPPMVSGGLSGLHTGHPSLHFAVRAGSAKLKGASVFLPRGLSFVAKRIKHGVRVTRSCTIKVHGSTLSISCRRAVASIAVSIGGGALKVSSALEKAAKRHRIASIRVSVRATPVSGRAVGLTFTVKKPS